jgi:glycosyltransferase involved in cell wall biosynthesis
MNVLFFTTAYPTPEAPAAGVFVQEHARAVAPYADVVVVHLHRDEHARRPFSIERVEADPPVWRVRYRYRPLLLSLACHFVGAVAAYRRVSRSGFRPDLLHAHFFLAAGPAALLSLATRIPYVATEQWTAFLPEDPTELGPVWRRAARASLRRARLLLPVSEDLRDAMRDAGITGRYRVVPNAVDVSLFRPGGDGRQRLLTVGLLGPQKGVDVLLRAFSRLPGDLALDVVGDGPGRREYEALAAELGVDDRVVFHGLQPKARIAELMQDAALFVLASRYDNNPCVLVEAQAGGLPIVSTTVGGIPEIVGDAGLLVERDDPAALADAIEQALRDSDRWDRAAIAAAARERYSFEAVGAALADAYRSALA